MGALSWIDLETRFRALRPALPYYRLDYQWGAAGEYWYLQGGPSSAAIVEFETLATIAGDLLTALPPEAVAPEALAESNAMHRWYLALWHHMTSQVPKHLTHQVDEEGRDRGALFSGTIEEPAHASAVLCLRFSTVPSLENQRADSPVKRQCWLMELLKHEAKERRPFWVVIGFVIMALLAALALF